MDLFFKKILLDESNLGQPIGDSKWWDWPQGEDGKYYFKTRIFYDKNYSLEKEPQTILMLSGYDIVHSGGQMASIELEAEFPEDMAGKCGFVLVCKTQYNPKNIWSLQVSCLVKH